MAATTSSAATTAVPSSVGHHTSGGGSDHSLSGHSHGHGQHRVSLPGTLTDKNGTSVTLPPNQTPNNGNGNGHDSGRTSSSITVHHAPSSTSNGSGNGNTSSGSGSDAPTFVVSVRAEGGGHNDVTPSAATPQGPPGSAPGGHHAVGAVPPCWLGPNEAKRPTRDIRMTCGHFSMQGVRNEMEDKTTLLPHPQFNKEVNLNDNESRSFFAVYDGHGGDVSAEYCHLHVHMNLVNDIMFGRDAAAALRNAVMKTDADFCAACRRIHLLTSSGTTAICAYLEADMLTVANVGDSRGVLCRAGKAIAISFDHKPGRPDERARIEALGGRIGTSEEEAFRGKKKGCCQCLRRCFSPRRPLRVFPGGLSVSRTIGDISLKSTSLIISDPEMYRAQLWPEDECMVLACDGVWDVMNNQQVVDVVRRYLEDPEEAARAVAKEAYRRGSTDNISVIVVVFIQPKP